MTINTIIVNRLAELEEMTGYMARDAEAAQGVPGMLLARIAVQIDEAAGIVARTWDALLEGLSER